MCENCIVVQLNGIPIGELFGILNAVIILGEFLVSKGWEQIYFATQSSQIDFGFDTNQ